MTISPENIFENTLDRIKEIVWWNRSLTKLHDEKYFKNFNESLDNQLINYKGPFIKYVKPPKYVIYEGFVLLANIK